MAYSEFNRILPNLNRGYAFLFALFFATQVSAQDASKTNETVENSIGMKFVLIPSGKFDMGSPPGRSMFPGEMLHTVEITQSFYMGVQRIASRGSGLVFGVQV